MPGAAARFTPADDLPRIVDVESGAVGTAERTEIGHHAVLQQKCMAAGVAGDLTLSHHVTPVVDPEGNALAATQCSQTSHDAVGPAKRSHLARGVLGRPDHLSDVIDVEGLGIIAAEGGAKMGG